GRRHDGVIRARQSGDGIEQDDDIPLVLDKAFGFFNDHFGNLDVARCRFVKRRADDFAVHRTLHVGYFFRPLIDKEDDQDNLRMIGRNGVRDRLEQHRLSCSRRSYNQAALSLSDRSEKVEYSSGKILFSVRSFELQPFIRIQRRQVVEKDLVSSFVWMLEVDGLDLDQGKITLTV